MRIGLHGKSISAEAGPFVQHILETLQSQAVTLLLTEPMQQALAKSRLRLPEHEPYEKPEQLSELDFFMSIGGDGTLLELLTLIGPAQVPMVGINTGRLGFLAIIAKESFDRALHLLLSGRYQIEDRALIRFESEKNPFGDTCFGLNEFTIHKKDSSSMITVHTYIDGHYLNSYWADGLIVSTPTGSTGYSLSCGGPIVFPASNNFIISPVSPHNLNVRPIVVADSSVLAFEVEGRSQNYLISLDSRSRTVSNKIKMQVKRRISLQSWFASMNGHFSRL